MSPQREYHVTIKRADGVPLHETTCAARFPEMARNMALVGYRRETGASLGGLRVTTRTPEGETIHETLE